MYYASDPLYVVLNKTSNFRTKLSPSIKFEGRYVVAVVDCFIKNIYDILRKETPYEIEIRPFDFGDDGTVANFDSNDYPIATIPYRDYNNMHEL
jgi:hypothetical protein